MSCSLLSCKFINALLQTLRCYFYFFFISVGSTCDMQWLRKSHQTSLFRRKLFPNDNSLLVTPPVRLILCLPCNLLCLQDIFKYCVDTESMSIFTLQTHSQGGPSSGADKHCDPVKNWLDLTSCQLAYKYKDPPTPSNKANREGEQRAVLISLYIFCSHIDSSDCLDDIWGLSHDRKRNIHIDLT